METFSPKAKTAEQRTAEALDAQTLFLVAKIKMLERQIQKLEDEIEELKTESNTKEDQLTTELENTRVEKESITKNLAALKIELAELRQKNSESEKGHPILEFITVAKKIEGLPPEELHTALRLIEDLGRRIRDSLGLNPTEDEIPAVETATSPENPPNHPKGPEIIRGEIYKLNPKENEKILSEKPTEAFRPYRATGEKKEIYGQKLHEFDSPGMNRSFKPANLMQLEDGMALSFELFEVLTEAIREIGLRKGKRNPKPEDLTVLATYIENNKEEIKEMKPEEAKLQFLRKLSAIT